MGYWDSRNRDGSLGRNAYREVHEQPDDRPCIARSQFWKSETERLTYEHAVEANPKRPDEGAGTYIQRIASIAAAKLGTLPPEEIKSMPSIPEWTGKEHEDWWDK